MLNVNYLWFQSCVVSVGKFLLLSVLLWTLQNALPNDTKMFPLQIGLLFPRTCLLHGPNLLVLISTPSWRKCMTSLKQQPEIELKDSLYPWRWGCLKSTSLTVGSFWSLKTHNSFAYEEINTSCYRCSVWCNFWEEQLYSGWIFWIMSITLQCSKFNTPCTKIFPCLCKFMSLRNLLLFFCSDIQNFEIVVLKSQISEANSFQCIMW